MLLEMPKPQRLRSLTVASWMLFPDPCDEIPRQNIRAVIQRYRLSSNFAEAELSKPPQPFIWEQLTPNELTLVQNPRAFEPSRPTEIKIGEDSATVMHIGRALLQEQTTQQRDHGSFQLAYRKGLTAGCVLLACYIYDSANAPGHKSSKARGESAAGGITGMRAKTVQNSFRSHKHVAHLWASYLICSEERFLSMFHLGLKPCTKALMPDDFLEVMDFDYFSAVASELAYYGICKKNSHSALLDRPQLVEISALPDYFKTCNIPTSIVKSFLQHYPPGKRDTRPQSFL